MTLGEQFLLRHKHLVQAVAGELGRG